MQSNKKRIGIIEESILNSLQYELKIREKEVTKNESDLSVSF